MNKSGNLSSVLMLSVILSAVIILVIIAGVLFFPKNEWRKSVCPCDLTNEWSYGDGSPVDMGGGIRYEGGSASLFYKYDSNDSHDVYDSNTSLCFRSHNVVFSIYADEQCIYDFHPKLGGIYGTCYGDCIHTVVIPHNAETVTINVTSLKDDSYDGFHEIVFQDSAAYIHDLAKLNLPPFCICAAAMLLGIAIFVFGLLASNTHQEMTEAVCLGAIAIIMAVWCHTQIRIMHIIAPNPLMIRLMDYAAMELVPIPVWVFAASFTKNLHHPAVYVAVGLSSLNFLLSVILTAFGAADYADFLPITHGLIVIGTIGIIVMIKVSARSGKIEIKRVSYMIYAFLAIAAGALLDLVFFYIWGSSSLNRMSRIGLAIFVCVIAYQEFMQFVNVRVTKTQAELMERLAMEDSLTGVGSRTAFHAYEKKLRERKDGQVLFVHFDVNNLKRVNDTYGHAEGDKFIIAAAECIKEGFGMYHCFRVGGDEFFAVIDPDAEAADRGRNVDELYQCGLKKFLQAQDEYNLTGKSPVPLFIAYGMSTCELDKDDLEQAELLADSRMYEKKREMKGKLAEKA